MPGSFFSEARKPLPSTGYTVDTGEALIKGIEDHVKHLTIWKNLQARGQGGEASNPEVIETRKEAVRAISELKESVNRAVYLDALVNVKADEKPIEKEETPSLQGPSR